jgi:diguanylate cyclase
VLEAVEAAIVRVQRALTRRFFLHNNERQLITFSAGVAQFTKGESWDTILERADRALYEAKRLGKNRVVLAAPAVPPIVTPAAGSRGRSA